MLESRQKHQLKTLQNIQNRVNEAELRIKLNERLIRFLLSDFHRIHESRRSVKMGQKELKQDAKIKRLLANIYPGDETANSS